MPKLSPRQWKKAKRALRSLLPKMRTGYLMNRTDKDNRLRQVRKFGK